MRKLIRYSIAILPFIFCAQSYAVNKCIDSSGNVSYQETSCPHNTESKSIKVPSRGVEEESSDAKTEKYLAGIEAQRAQREATTALLNGENSEKYKAAKEKADAALSRANMSQDERAYDIERENSKNLKIEQERRQQEAQRQQLHQEQEKNQKLAEISENLEEIKKIEKRRQIEEANKPPPQQRSQHCTGKIDQWGRVDATCN